MFIRMVITLLSLMFSVNLMAQENNIDTYRLGSGDLVKITVYGQTDLSVETRLSDTGVINYPYLGEIRAVNMSISALENFIYNGLKGDYLVKPSVSISVIEYRPFFINGEVQRPGGYPFQPGLSVDKAAAIAGGYTERAAEEKVTIVREINGKTLTFNGTGKDSVLPGDIITVKQSFF